MTKSLIQLLTESIGNVNPTPTPFMDMIKRDKKAGKTRKRKVYKSGKAPVAELASDATIRGT